jgi:predicted phosphodiesterase
MKRLLVGTLAVMLLVGAMALSGNGPKVPVGDVQVEVEKRNPWTSLRLNNEQDTFHFAIVSDRTGGHRARIFSQAVEQLNLLQPSFVVSVGDLIEGYTKDQAKLAEEWKEFQSYAHRLQMPFFYVPGNHDIANPIQVEQWQERFGRRYYHFLYKDVLFLLLCSDDPSEDKARAQMSEEQVKYVQKVLQDNPKVRWTLLFLHKPLWAEGNPETSRWLEVEKALQGRPYTVFAGHVHRYQKFVRQGQNYYQLATTGGGSKLRGLPYGEFDHIVWVTMKKEGPVLANILLEGILPENLKTTITDEEGYIAYNRKPAYPVRGKVLLDGSPLPLARVEFYALDPDPKKMVRMADALVEADGSFAMSAYKAFDGAPAGDYAVTVTWRMPLYDEAGKPGQNKLPEKYASPKTTDLRAKVKAGEPNTLTFNLSQ